MANVLVLASPTQPAAGSTAPVSGNYILRVPASKAPKFAYMGQNGTFWLVLRPASGANGTQAVSLPKNGIFETSGGQ
jgi:hypothetical protein